MHRTLTSWTPASAALAVMRATSAPLNAAGRFLGTLISDIPPRNRLKVPSGWDEAASERIRIAFRDVSFPDVSNDTILGWFVPRISNALCSRSIPEADARVEGFPVLVCLRHPPGRRSQLPVQHHNLGLGPGVVGVPPPSPELVRGIAGTDVLVAFRALHAALGVLGLDGLLDGGRGRRELAADVALVVHGLGSSMLLGTRLAGGPRRDRGILVASDADPVGLVLCDGGAIPLGALCSARITGPAAMLRVMVVAGHVRSISAPTMSANFTVMFFGA